MVSPVVGWTTGTRKFSRSITAASLCAALDDFSYSSISGIKYEGELCHMDAETKCNPSCVIVFGFINRRAGIYFVGTGVGRTDSIASLRIIGS